MPTAVPSTRPTDLADLHPDDARALARLQAGAAAVLPEGSLAERLAQARRDGRPLRVKLGIDPSGSELTLGHAVVLRTLRQFQDAGHLPVLIVGDFTGMVGDPAGKSGVRPALSAQDTERNAATYFEQVGRILDMRRVEVRRNSEWLAGLTMADVVREARHLTVAQLLERDDFARRYADGRPISLVEFLYPLLQGYDSVAVHADVELGGTDQTYNLHVGRELQRAHGQPPQVILTVPLLEGLDGVQKMGKSLDNYVSIVEDPDQQFGKLMSVPDGLVSRYLLLCTDLSAGRVAALAGQAGAGGPGAGLAKRVMAHEVVALYHGRDAADRAQARFDATFARRELPAEVAEHALRLGADVHLPALLVDALGVSSRSQARRFLQEGAVRLDGQVLDAAILDVPAAELVGRVLQVGRRRAVRLVAAPP